MAKIKIFNDPVYGFLQFPEGIIFDLIDHPCFQRLRRIKQLGMTHLVYPGALHTRFHHGLGALHLLTLALESLKSKGIKISEEEREAASIAILLHDIGHGPFSHALEGNLIEGIDHEELTILFMERLNKEFSGKLSMALDIFHDRYSRKFFHQLVSGQLDLDRLDYLRRDSFYTGVSEGVIGSDRIIKMLHVSNDNLVVEVKGIYSIEKFLLARRLMYWQVYLHKTVVSAEELLIKIFRRAKELARKGEELFATPPFRFFLYEPVKTADYRENPKILDTFALLDDYDVLASIKVWATHSDPVLSRLCKMLINRRLLKIEFQNEPFPMEKINIHLNKAAMAFRITPEEAAYFVFSSKVENRTYAEDEVQIGILMKDQTVKNLTEVSDQYDLTTLNKRAAKYFLCSPKDISEL